MSFHIRDEHITSLQLQVEFIKVRTDIHEEAESTEPNLVRETFEAFQAPFTDENNDLMAKSEDMPQDITTTELANPSVVK